MKRKFGRYSEQARNPNQYREELQRQASAQATAELAAGQLAEAQGAAYGSLAQVNNPMNAGSVFRNQNAAMANQYDQSVVAQREETEEKNRRRIEDDEYRRLSRSRSLMR